MKESRIPSPIQTSTIALLRAAYGDIKNRDLLLQYATSSATEMAQWKNTGGTRWTLQSFRIAANWHVDLRLLAIPYFLLFKKPLITRYFRPRILLWANMRLSWAIKWRFWDTISLFLRWIFLWTYVLRFMDVRPKGLCTYVLRVYGRTS